MKPVKITVEAIDTICKERGIHLTKKRKNILMILIESKKALSAYDIISLLKQKYHDRMQAMSVYRILDFLQTHHLAHKLTQAKKYIACSHLSCPHTQCTSQFLICSQCHQVKEVHLEKSSIHVLQSSAQAEGFQLTMTQLEMNGLCDQCFSE